MLVTEKHTKIMDIVLFIIFQTKWEHISVATGLIGQASIATSASWAAEVPMFHA